MNIWDWYLKDQLHENHHELIFKGKYLKLLLYLCDNQLIPLPFWRTHVNIWPGTSLKTYSYYNTVAFGLRVLWRHGSFYKSQVTPWWFISVITERTIMFFPDTNNKWACVFKYRKRFLILCIYCTYRSFIQVSYTLNARSWSISTQL